MDDDPYTVTTYLLKSNQKHIVGIMTVVTMCFAVFFKVFLKPLANRPFLRVSARFLTLCLFWYKVVFLFYRRSDVNPKVRERGLFFALFIPSATFLPARFRFRRR